MAIHLQDPGCLFHKRGGQDVVFEAANQDLSDATYQYFGYLSADGAWIIQRFHIISSAIIYEYIGGQSVTDYATYWDANGLYIGALTFGRYDEIKDL